MFSFLQRQGYKLQNYIKFDGYTCFYRVLNNGQNTVALIMKHPVYSYVLLDKRKKFEELQYYVHLSTIRSFHANV